MTPEQARLDEARSWGRMIGAVVLFVAACVVTVLVLGVAWIARRLGT